MKKLTTLFFALLLALSLVACGNTNENNSNGDNNPSRTNGGTVAIDITPIPCKISVHDFFITSIDSEPYIVLYLDITNEADKSLSTDNLASPFLYQDGAQVADIHDEDSWMKGDRIVFPDGFEPALRYVDKIQSGATATVYYVLLIKNTTDDISIEVYGCENHLTDDGSNYIYVSEDVIFTDTLKIS